jgi:glutamine amidotransferase
VVPLEPAGGLPVPHVGWNEVAYPANSPMFLKAGDRPHFYFDHSYGLDATADGVVATVEYGGRWAAAVARDNIFAVQFHPEKSQRTGLRLLRNFLNSLPADRC